MFESVLVTKDGDSNEITVSRLKKEALGDGTYADGRESDWADSDISQPEAIDNVVNTGNNIFVCWFITAPIDATGSRNFALPS